MNATIESKEDNKGKVCVIGMFDGVHAGHRFLLRKAVEKACALHTSSMVITFANHPMSVICRERVPKYLCTLQQRVKMIKECGIDTVVTLDFDENVRQMTAAEFLNFIGKHYHVEHLIMGYDHGFGSDGLKNTDDYVNAAKNSGIKIERAEKFTIDSTDVAVSSSSVRQALASGDVSLASKLLSYPYTLEGRVIEGRHLGSKIGFPTANIDVDDIEKKSIMIPCDGVYGCKADIDGIEYTAMTNVGENPTVSDNKICKIEVHIIDFTGDLYGKNIKISFVEKLRDEQKFKSIDELRVALERDCRQVKEMFAKK